MPHAEGAFRPQPCLSVPWSPAWPLHPGQSPPADCLPVFPPRSGDQARALPYGCVGCTSLLKRWRLQGGDHAGRPPQTAGHGVCG